MSRKALSEAETEEIKLGEDCRHISPDTGGKYTSRYCPQCGRTINALLLGDSACRLSHLAARSHGKAYCRSCAVDLQKYCQPYHLLAVMSGWNYCPLGRERLSHKPATELLQQASCAPQLHKVCTDSCWNYCPRCGEPQTTTAKQLAEDMAA